MDGIGGESDLRSVSRSGMNIPVEFKGSPPLLVSFGEDSF